MSRCEIVKDLIPLCVDEVASKSSVDFVNEHILTCAECREEMQNMKSSLHIPLSAEEQLKGAKPFEKMRQILTRRMIKTAVISVLAVCAVIGVCFLSTQKKVMISEVEAAQHACLVARAYIEFHTDEFPRADYNEIKPAATVELVEDEGTFGTVYKVRVKYDVPDAADDPVFLIVLDPYSGNTLKNSVVQY